MMQDFGSRLEKVRAELGYTQDSMADRIKMSKRSYCAYEANETPPSAKALAALAALGVDVNYLLTGRPPLGAANDFAYVPRYEVTASAGHGAVVTDESVVDHLAFKQRWITVEMGLDPKHLALITVRGDSMQGTLDEGDLILLDTRPLERRLKPGIYVIRLNGDLLVKRLTRKVNGDIDVVSDNPHYKTETVPAKEVSGLEIVGKVIWQGRKI